MRISVTADVHLRTRVEHPERYNALENIFEQTSTEGVENLLIAGDLFDKDFRSYSEFEELCRKYSKLGLHIIPGNHDPSISGMSIVGDNIHIYTDSTALEIDSTTFLFIPYEEKAKMGEKIAEMEKEIEGKEWILVAHGDYYGGAKELNPLEPGTYMPLSRKDLERFNPRTVLLGHIHRPLSQNNVHYAGSPCGLDINETGRRRFLVYDTADGSIVPRVVRTDVLYFYESFVIVPMDDEVTMLQQEIKERIESWNIDRSEYPKVRVRVEAVGYATDRRAVLAALEKGFERFKYFKDEGPKIERLLASSDYQLNAIAERTMKLIDELDWTFGGDEPAKEHVKIAALSVIYGD
ncbi:MAG: metallophosphoesterase [Deltaproteobacteria bacterium]|nr:metallophosphoesterase [Deltaproteobacteria bacterium]MBW2340966.1 metallophosphoesterase [Deltaproteobacteria bacterium]